MPSDLAFVTSALFFVAGLLFLINFGIVFRRFLRTYLWMSVLRGINFIFYCCVNFAFTWGILASNLEIATNGYRILAIAFLSTEIINIIYMNYVNFGHFRDIMGAVMIFLYSLNFAMLWFPENLVVTYFPSLDAYYPVLSPVFFLTNFVFGVFHTSLNAIANFRVLRRPDVSWQNKMKFVFLTGGIVLFYATFVVTLFSVMVFGDANGFIWAAVINIVAFGLTFTGLFYANSSVFTLPIRLYLLVIFGAGGEILYEKWFSKRESETAALLPKAAASIASLVDHAFAQSQQMHLISLQNRRILFEWKKGLGIMLIADQDSSVFRNSMQRLLLRLESPHTKKKEIDTQVQQIFDYYPIEFDKKANIGQF